MIKATYKNNLEEYRTYLNHTVFITNGGRKNIIMLAVIAGVLLAVGFIFPILWLLAFLFMIVLLFKFLGYRGGIKKNLSILDKNYKEFTKVSNDYEFTEENFYVINKKQGKVEVKYEEVYRIEETLNFFYIYMNKSIAYLIRKKDIVEGSSEELSDLFTKVIGEKHKKRGKR